MTRTICFPKMLLLGYEKCGTSDISAFIESNADVINYSWSPYFNGRGESPRQQVTSMCPSDWLEEENNIKPFRGMERAYDE